MVAVTINRACTTDSLSSANGLIEVSSIYMLLGLIRPVDVSVKRQAMALNISDIEIIEHRASGFNNSHSDIAQF